MTTLSDSSRTTAARLIIHSGGVTAGSRLAFLARRFRARAPLRLHIDGPQGARVLALDDAGSRVEVALPAGTYRITVQQGDLQRSYTMTLSAGDSSDLHLRLPVAADHGATAAALGGPTRKS